MTDATMEAKVLKRLLAIVAIVLLCSLPAFASQILIVKSIAGARCTITRDGDMIAVFVESGEGDRIAIKFVTIVSSPHDHDIVVTCAKPGFKTQSRTLAQGPTRWTSDGPLCSPPKGYTRQQLQTYCDDFFRREWHENPIVWEYPGTTLRLEPDNVN